MSSYHSYELLERFNQAIDFWIQALDHYSREDLNYKKSRDIWSVGQLYAHLHDDTTFYLSQIKACMASHDFTDEKPTQSGVQMFEQDAFPDIRIRGAADHAFMRQPDSVWSVKNDFLQLRKNMKQTVDSLMTVACRGKSRHPGLGYFDVYQWLQFAGMHMRHHQKQKKILDEYLKSRLNGPANS